MKKFKLLSILIFALNVSEIYSVSPFPEIDQHAKSTPDTVENSIPELAAYLIKPARTDTEKARAIYIWLVHNVVYDANSLMGHIYDDKAINSTRYDPSAILKTRKAVCGGYAKLFVALCSAVNLEAKVVSGMMKNTDAFFGKEADRNAFKGGVNHAWNVIKLEGKWYFVEPTTGASWGLPIEPKSGKMFYNPPMIDYFFMTPPDKMIQTHLPIKEEWQLLDKPLSRQVFQENPYFFPGMFLHNALLLEPASYHVICDKHPRITLENIIGKKYVMAMIYKDAYFLPDGKVNQHELVRFSEDERISGRYTAELNLPQKGRYIVIVMIGYYEGKDWRGDLTLAIEYECR